MTTEIEYRIKWEKGNGNTEFAIFKSQKKAREWADFLEKKGLVILEIKRLKPTELLIFEK